MRVSILCRFPVPNGSPQATSPSCSAELEDQPLQIQMLIQYYLPYEGMVLHRLHIIHSDTNNDKQYFTVVAPFTGD